jgi:hypothetical protein
MELRGSDLGSPLWGPEITTWASEPTEQPLTHPAAVGKVSDFPSGTETEVLWLGPRLAPS